MHRCLMLAIVSLFVLALTEDILADDAPWKESLRELHEARRTGWQLARLVLDKIETGDQTQFPGIQTWLAELQKKLKGISSKEEPWLALDIDALITHNPTFWQAYYEIAPGDPGLMVMHAGLLLSGGEATRASHIIVVGTQRPGIPKEINQAFRILLAQTQLAPRKSNALVMDGIKLYDKVDYAGALKKHREALDLWPQNGFAYYEAGLTLRQQEHTAAGEKPIPLDTVKINAGKKNSQEVDAAFAKARRHDPFQIRAYQGDDPEVIKGFLALGKKGLPAWQKINQQAPKGVADESLQDLAVACQEANVHELALVIRQVLVARRGGYAPADHPFIATSLRKIAPGAQTEATLEKLAGRKLELRQLVVPTVITP